jgi:hypothetical protein
MTSSPEFLQRIRARVADPDDLRQRLSQLPPAEENPGDPAASDESESSTGITAPLCFGK